MVQHDTEETLSLICALKGPAFSIPKSASTKLHLEHDNCVICVYYELPVNTF